MSNNTFSLVITAHDTIIYNGDAFSCTLTTPDGCLGLEAHHEPLLGILKKDSKISYTDAAAQKKTAAIKHGFFSFNRNKCTIVVGV